MSRSFPRRRHDHRLRVGWRGLGAVPPLQRWRGSTGWDVQAPAGWTRRDLHHARGRRRRARDQRRHGLDHADWRSVQRLHELGHGPGGQHPGRLAFTARSSCFCESGFSAALATSGPAPALVDLSAEQDSVELSRLRRREPLRPKHLDDLICELPLFRRKRWWIHIPVQTSTNVFVEPRRRVRELVSESVQPANLLEQGLELRVANRHDPRSVSRGSGLDDRGDNASCTALAGAREVENGSHARAQSRGRRADQRRDPPHDPGVVAQARSTLAHASRRSPELSRCRDLNSGPLVRSRVPRRHADGCVSSENRAFCGATRCGETQPEEPSPYARRTRAARFGGVLASATSPRSLRRHARSDGELRGAATITA